MAAVKDIMVWDDFHGYPFRQRDVIGTLTTQVGNPSKGHSYKIIEIYEIQQRQPIACLHGLFRL